MYEFFYFDNYIGVNNMHYNSIKHLFRSFKLRQKDLENKKYSVSLICHYFCKRRVPDLAFIRHVSDFLQTKSNLEEYKLLKEVDLSVENLKDLFLKREKRYERNY